MEVLTAPAAMRAWADAARGRGYRLALVPTMGALHAGHLRLVAEACQRADRVVVSIFVNPIQFDRREDLERYPRALEEDLARCAEAGVAAVYAPAASAMYPPGFQTAVEVGPLAEPLCGRGRPGHFRGVATVVTKLFNTVRPQVALFGEKDYQQLAIVRRLVADLDFDIEVVGVPTVREADGLALSSRNRRLDPEGRAAARCIPRALEAVACAVAAGERRGDALLAHATAVIAAEPAARLEYAELRDPETIEPVTTVTAPTLLALAVWVDGVRLIDNRLLRPEESDRP